MARFADAVQCKAILGMSNTPAPAVRSAVHPAEGTERDSSPQQGRKHSLIKGGPHRQSSMQSEGDEVRAMARRLLLAGSNFDSENGK